MIKVLEIKPSKTDTMLICEKFDNDKVTDILKTNIGNFFKGEFTIGKYTYCFNEPTASIIFIRGNKDCSKIKEVEFG